MSFARTKTQPPRQRAGSIELPALEQRLDAAFAGCKLVLLAVSWRIASLKIPTPPFCC
jgi:hypothetical protein